MILIFFYSHSLSEELLHCLLSSTKLPRVCRYWCGWWCCDSLLWQQHREGSAQTGLDEQSHRRWSTVLGSAESDLCGAAPGVQKQHWDCKGALQPNWRCVYISLFIFINTHTHNVVVYLYGIYIFRKRIMFNL